MLLKSGPKTRKGKRMKKVRNVRNASFRTPFLNARATLQASLTILCARDVFLCKNEGLCM